MAIELRPSPTLTLKSMVIQLIESTNPQYTDPEIAAKVGRDVRYVRKIKCLHNKSKKLANSSSMTQQEHQQPKAHARDLASTSKQAFGWLQQQPSLSNEERIRVWISFDQGIKPIEVVKATGHPPQLIEYEYGMYLKFKNINSEEIQRKLLEKIGQSMDYVKRLPDDMQKEYSLILDEYKRRGYLETQQHLRLEQIYERICLLKGKNFVRNLSENPPDGWSRPLCKICGQPFYGAIVDPSDNMGKSVLDSLKIWVHKACTEKQLDAKTKTIVAKK